MSSKKENKLPKEYVEEVVKDCKTIADFCRKVGWQPRGANYQVFHKYVYEYGLDISHFTNKNTDIHDFLTEKSDKYLHEGSFKITTNRLLKKLLDEGKKEHQCECCGNKEWNNKPIPLELHHINGIHSDNRLENLMVLCPNCHAQTDNYRGKKARREKKKYYCSCCGKEVTRYCKTGLCLKCQHIQQRRAIWPTKEELEQLHSEYSNVKIGKIYGVSDVTIKKWLNYYGIIK